MLLPAVNAAREAARRTQSMNNLKQIGLCTIMYTDDNNGLFPTRTSASGRWIDVLFDYKSDGRLGVRGEATIGREEQGASRRVGCRRGKDERGEQQRRQSRHR